jgi:hypothetical protein
MFRLKVNGYKEATGDVKLAMHEGVQNGLEKIGLRGEALAKSGAPVGATGQLANSQAMQLSENRVEIFVGPPADVYGAPVEFGSKPHFPPVDALMLWVKKKFNPANDQDAKSIAFAIARSIAKRGTKATHFFENAMDLLEKEAPGIMEHELAEALRAHGYGG